MDIPYEKTIADLFRWRVAESGDDIAHKFLDKETTYSELDSFANKVAQGLIALDCSPDSRVAFLGKNSDLFFEFLYGTIKSNTVTVGINWRLAPPEVAYIINDSKSEVLLVGPEFFGLIEEIKNDINTLNAQAQSKRELLLRALGAIEYLQQIGVTLEEQTPVVTPPPTAKPKSKAKGS